MPVNEVKITIKTIIWQGDAFGLFDFESSNFVKEEYILSPTRPKMSYFISRLSSMYFYVRSELEPLIEGATDVCEIKCLNGSYCLIQSNNPSNLLWDVLRSRHNQQCKIGVGERLRLGKFEMRLRELVISNKKAFRVPVDVQEKYRDLKCPTHGLWRDTDLESFWMRKEIDSGHGESVVTHFNLVPEDSESDCDSDDLNEKNQTHESACTCTLIKNSDFQIPQTENTEEERICRICFDEETDETENPLIIPCKCKGSSSFIHLNCLRRWMEGRLKLPEEAATATQAMLLDEYELAREENERSLRQSQNPFGDVGASSVTNFIHNPFYRTRDPHVVAPLRIQLSPPPNGGPQIDSPLSPRRVPSVLAESLSPSPSHQQRRSPHQNNHPVAQPTTTSVDQNEDFSSFRTQATSFFYCQLSCEICKKPYPPSVTVKSRVLDILPLPRPAPPYAILEVSVQRSKGEAMEGMHVVSLATHPARLGRRADSEIRINDVSVSRLHATLAVDETDDSKLVLQDCSSKFGSGKLQPMRQNLAVDGSQVFLQCGPCIIILSIDDQMRVFIPPSSKTSKQSRRYTTKSYLGMLLRQNKECNDSLNAPLVEQQNLIPSPPPSPSFWCCRKKTQNTPDEISPSPHVPRRGEAETRVEVSLSFDENVVTERLLLDGIVENKAADFHLPDVLRRKLPSIGTKTKSSRPYSFH
eukprot:GDKJ01052201.1.p1 GENE.GDKJ01052201.1~~GDKJ01052201.1.p1  ORF type:complete len:697 (-),score=107.58 GDKJ01052201.1:129-2219(-)